MGQNKRHQYGLKAELIKEQQQLICRQISCREPYSSGELACYLQSQGYDLQPNQIAKITNKLYGKNEDLTLNQMIGVAARLAVDDELERQMKRVFNFFSGGEDVLTTQQLKFGMQRLGQGLKERQLNQIVIDMDLNSNGYIDFQTFLEAMLLQ